MVTAQVQCSGVHGSRLDDEKWVRSLDEFRAHQALLIDQAVLHTNLERILCYPINIMKIIKQLTLNGER